MPPESPSVSSLIMSNTSYVQRIGVIEELTFSLIPVDPYQTLNLYNTRYNTGIPYSTVISRTTIVAMLQEAPFTFFSRNKEIVYRVKANFIKEKRQKKSAPIYKTFCF